MDYNLKCLYKYLLSDRYKVIYIIRLSAGYEIDLIRKDSRYGFWPDTKIMLYEPMTG